MNKETIEKLLDELDDHDCHLSEDDGCICQEILEKMADSNY